AGQRVTIKNMAINGFAGGGIVLDGIAPNMASDNIITGNYIGTNASGTAAVGNGQGIGIGSNAMNNLVGRMSAAERNVISGNAFGMVIAQNATANRVVGNYVATDVSGTKAIGKATAVIHSAIYKNTTIGIDLGNDGVTPDDATDADTGPNGLQNFPLIQSAKPTLSGIAVTFSVDSSSVASTHTIGVEVFKADSSSVRQG